MMQDQCSTITFVIWTHFACIASRSALLPAAILSPCSLSIPLSSLSLLWEGLRLWLGKRRSFRTLVEGGRGTGWGLQEPADGWMVQHSGITLRRMLRYRGNGGCCFCTEHRPVPYIDYQLTDYDICGMLPQEALLFQHWHSNWPRYMPLTCPSSSWLHWGAAIYRKINDSKCCALY